MELGYSNSAVCEAASVCQWCFDVYLMEVSTNSCTVASAGNFGYITDSRVHIAFD